MFGPRGESERNQGVPRTEQIEIAIAEAGVFKGTCQVKAKIVCGGGHGRNFAAGVKALIGGGENAREQFLLLFAGNDVEPDGEYVGMLAEVLLRRGVGEEGVFAVPAELFHTGDCAVGGGGIYFGGGA